MGDQRRARGSLGERIAASHLESRGYALLETNARAGRGEIDLIAHGRGCLVFCEVKTRVAGARAGPALPLEAVNGPKRRQLRRSAYRWLRDHDGQRPYAPRLRFDAIGVVLSPAGEVLALEHLEDAF